MPIVLRITDGYRNKSYLTKHGRSVSLVSSNGTPLSLGYLTTDAAFLDFKLGKAATAAECVALLNSDAAYRHATAVIDVLEDEGEAP